MKTITHTFKYLLLCLLFNLIPPSRSCIYAVDESFIIQNEHESYLDLALFQDVICAVGMVDRTALIQLIHDDLSLVWERRLTGSMYSSAYSVRVDNLGNIYAAGEFLTNIVFESDENRTELNSNGMLDVFLCKYNIDGDLEWARSFGTNMNDNISCIVLNQDASQIYVIGNYSNDISTQNFDTSTSQTGGRSYLLAYSYEGELQQFYCFGGTVTSADLNNNGDIYISGYYIGEVNLNPVADQQMLNSNYYTGYVLKLNKNFEVESINTNILPVENKCLDLSVNKQGEVIVIGSVYDSIECATDYDEIEYNYNGNGDSWLAKLSSECKLIWLSAWGGTQYDMCKDVEIADNGDIYVTGAFAGLLDIDSGNDNDNISSVMRNSLGLLDPNGEFTLISYDALLLKYSDDGDFVWVKKWGSAGYDTGRRIAIQDETIYVVGSDFENNSIIGYKADGQLMDFDAFE